MTQISIKQACLAIGQGNVVVFPTETVYGLGADACNDEAVAQVFALKNRPTFNPLIVHVASLEAAQKIAIFNEQALKVAHMFWPGPLTLVLPKKLSAGISLLASAGLDTIGVRIPAHPVAQEFLQTVGCPIAAPSANPSGGLSPTSVKHIQGYFGDQLLVLDGGPCHVGLESTIIDLSNEMPILLRPGGVTQEALSKELGPLAYRSHKGIPNSPGQLLNHYAPRIPLRMHATYVRAREAYLGFGKHELAGGTALLNLSSKGDLVEAAAHLFAYLHELDNSEYEGIAVAPIPEKGLGVAINDRLRRSMGACTLRTEATFTL